MLRPNRIFGVLCLASAVTLVAYAYWARTRVANDTVEVTKVEAPLPPASPTTGSSTDAMAPPSAAGASGVKAKPKSSSPSRTAASGNVQNNPVKQIFFRYNGVDSHYGRLAFVRHERPEQPQFIDALSCEVAHVAGGRGICLAASRGVFTTYSAKLFDAKTFQILAQFPLKGVPSRCRVSADGKVAALTVFVSGHSYASLDFSTQTLLIDVESARIIADLEEFPVLRDGQPFSSKDFNFWGVTFTPDGRNFYATLSTNRQHFLVKGDIARRSATVVHDNVECPSLSPNAARVAYKRRLVVEGRVFWQLHILDLMTGLETPLAEKRSVDDQLEWLDNDYVLYSLPENTGGPSASTNVWVAAADGVTAPRLFLKKAYSPSVVPLL
jgi:hypothetical protein